MSVNTRFRKMVELEISRIRKKTYLSQSLHEGYGLLMEEVDEFWDEVKKKHHKRNKKNIRHELVQVAALAEVISEDNT